MKIIQYSKFEYYTTHYLMFDYKGQPTMANSGYMFPCNPDGTVDAKTQARINKLDQHEYNEPYVEAFEHHTKMPTIGKCDYCGEEVHLTSFTNTCECGADYNSAGQLLAPREQWGEETGEHPSDIARIR